MKKIKRLFKYLFVKRVAVDPQFYKPYFIWGHNYFIKLYQWQRMPDGYRWF